MASVFETRSRPRGIGVSTLSGSRVTTAGSTTRRRIKEDHDPDKEFRREQVPDCSLDVINYFSKAIFETIYPLNRLHGSVMCGIYVL